MNEALKKDNSLSNTVQIDVHLLGFDPQQPKDWIRLASIGQDLNDRIRTKVDYPWLVGGDGPVFGLCQTEKCAHLRASLEYSIAVADEWMLIGQILEFSKEDNNLVAECWDLDDGQVLLIQSSHHLPKWVDEIGPGHCRHRCWIHNGQLSLIAPSFRDGNPEPEPLSLSEALKVFKSKESLIKTSPRMTECIVQTVQRVRNSELRHRAACAIPRSVLQLMKDRPDLIDAACNAFAQCRDLPKTNTYEDWVWTTHAFGRHQYAMLRSVVNKHFTTEDAIPKEYQSVEVRRLARQCRMEGVPHLRWALQIGIRVVAGLDILRGRKASSQFLGSVKENRVQSWRELLEACESRSQWLEDAWRAGPNHATVNLDPVLACPVHQRDVFAHPTPLSNPETSLSQQIEAILKRDPQDPRAADILPSPGDVDNEAWMTVPEEAELKRRITAEETATPLDLENQAEISGAVEEVIAGVQSFVNGESYVEGVSHEGFERPININPRAFLNILHATVKNENLTFSKTDPFFADSDYDIGDHDEEMMVTMNEMDAELQETLGDRTADNELETVENLMRSLQEAGSGPGPLQNMLREMGIDPLDVTDDDE